VFIPNPGNAGDAFIAHATYQLFDEINLTYDIGTLSNVYPNRVIILGGGGNLVGLYRNMAQFLENNLGTFEQLIILPHTIRAHEHLISRLNSNCFVFCREVPSYDFVKLHATQANVFIDDDLALSCDLLKTRNQMGNFVSELSGSLLLRDAKRFLRAGVHLAKSWRNRRLLNCMRADVERTNVAMPSLNIDLPQAFAGDDMSPASALHSMFFLMKFISFFETVCTNRLHVSVMAAMLGKTVRFSNNSYGKNFDIFVHSIQERYPNVHWQPCLTASESQCI
jgi:exopolysaccharide biosynthesis predicted pyruvyltransferase EpsI